MRSQGPDAPLWVAFNALVHELELWARERFPVGDVVDQWSGQGLTPGLERAGTGFRVVVD